MIEGIGGTVERTDFPSLKESTIDAESPGPRSEVLRHPMGLSDNLQCRKHRFDPWARKISWRRKWQPTPVFLPGKCHGERSLAGYSPWGRKESDTTERLSTHTPVCVVSTHSMGQLEFSISVKQVGCIYRQQLIDRETR